MDDLGLHSAVTRAIEDLSEFGTVTSASILANGPYIEDALRFNNKIGLGVHLNILRGKPLSNPSNINTFLNNNFIFLGDYKKLFCRYITGKIDYNQVEHEWDLQIKFLFDKGFSITHLDSEKHIHCCPKFSDTVINLADKYKILWVRRPMGKTKFFRFDKGKFRADLLSYLSKKFNTFSTNVFFLIYFIH